MWLTFYMTQRAAVVTEFQLSGFLPGSCSAFPSVPSSWSRGSKVKHFLPTFQVGRKDRLISLKCRSYSSVGSSLVLGPKSKSFKISAFKGSSRHDDSGGRANGSKSLKNPVKVSYLQQEGESPLESSKVQNVVPASYTAADGTTTRSLAIQNLFKKWLILLRTPPQSQSVGGALDEPCSTETSEMPNSMQKQERGEILKSVWCYFLGLDATIKIPFLMFTPLYLAVNLVYGSEVSKELTPLWILGPLIVVLYIKMFRAICSLYIFSFKQSVKVVKNLPAYYLLLHEYIFRGKLKEAIQRHLWQPIADLKNMDYKELTRRKMKDFQVWLVERYLDFIELIWPYYCRTIRFLKRANLI
ncbi:uncharacterized protein LOC105157246 isoform X2 [Sesamum indicum]|uniref:Uncharacterized protein LOC105157246 isoform X2 n=1 Tax=Sesamum indicum TaxID=4182 RepID=A0A8M8UX19_SESIN|nr:uncharacterized protein LOC105157246 isoform X2 [Sesamum indicum]